MPEMAAVLWPPWSASSLLILNLDCALSLEVLVLSDGDV